MQEWVKVNRSMPRGRIVLTPQRPGFQICGAVPSDVDFCGFIIQDVARIQQDTLTQDYKLLSPFLPCPGMVTRIASLSSLCTVMCAIISAPAHKYACSLPCYLTNSP